MASRGFLGRGRKEAMPLAVSPYNPSAFGQFLKAGAPASTSSGAHQRWLGAQPWKPIRNLRVECAGE